jgi:hypothetical protein
MTLPNRGPCSTVAGRTRLLDRCRTCREADRQATGSVVLLSEVVDRDSSERISQTLAPAHFPHTPPCAWARGYFDGLTGPVLRAGPDVETRPKSPSGGIRARETQVACGMSSPRRTARGKYYVRPIRHSEDRKMALHKESLPQCYNPNISVESKRPGNHLRAVEQRRMAAHRKRRPIEWTIHGRAFLTRS